MKCRECDQPLSPLRFIDYDKMPIEPPVMICMNQLCPLLGILTVVGIPSNDLEKLRAKHKTND